MQHREDEPLLSNIATSLCAALDPSLHAAMTASDWSERFRASKTPWFRGRTYHEYSVMRSSLKSLINFDNARILDFGCGERPVAAASIAIRHPQAEVIGYDIVSPDFTGLDKVLMEEVGQERPANLHIGEPSGRFDLVYSWSVFEHIAVPELRSCFTRIRDWLADDGVFFFQIAPLYHSPDGSHLNALSQSEPWYHLSHSIEETRIAVFKGRSAARLWQQFLELNRLTAHDFKDIAVSCGLRVMSELLLAVEIAPPVPLLRTYTREALTTSEVRIVFRK
jgi:hypothetical protein